MDNQKESNKGSFWTTLPGCITAVAALITAFVTCIAALYPIWKEMFSPPTAIPIPVITITPTITPLPVGDQNPITVTPSLTPTITPDPNLLVDEQGVTMRLVPAGEFTMGSNNGRNDERPVHQVYLDAFYMDIYEVTNAFYKACVTAGSCTFPQNTSSATRSNYYGDLQYGDYPVIYVNWTQAWTYCTWRGGSLPTEAQWEKAARSTDGRAFPWGEGIDSTRSNYNKSIGDTTKVGSYEIGKSPYGIYDLEGNVWEWVADWYSETYYQSSPITNPLGPDPGPYQYRVLRGDSWAGNGAPSTYRGLYFYEQNTPDVGFRCIRSLP